MGRHRPGTLPVGLLSPAQKKTPAARRPGAFRGVELAQGYLLSAAVSLLSAEALLSAALASPGFFFNILLVEAMMALTDFLSILPGFKA